MQLGGQWSQFLSTILLCSCFIISFALCFVNKSYKSIKRGLCDQSSTVLSWTVVLTIYFNIVAVTKLIVLRWEHIESAEATPRKKLATVTSH